MGTAESACLPQRLLLEVSVPQRRSDAAITQTWEMVSARLRYLLSQEYQRRSAARLRETLAARAARKAARLEAAARRSEEEAADQASKTARRVS
ncbi:hypothetical protein ACRUZW_25995 [Mycobacterium colombiense]